MHGQLKAHGRCNYRRACASMRVRKNIDIDFIHFYCRSGPRREVTCRVITLDIRH